MATDTFSLNITGASAENVNGPKSYVIGDSAADSMPYTMMQGGQFLVKGPDGSLAWYTLDASRSTPTNPVLLPVV